MHTPVPYEVNTQGLIEYEPGKRARQILISGPGFNDPATIGTAVADQAFVRRACNSHEDLVRELDNANSLLRAYLNGDAVAPAQTINAIECNDVLIAKATQS